MVLKALESLKEYTFNLYHYSPVPRTYLSATSTISHKKNIDIEKRDRSDSISLFFDPVPIELIRKHYPKESMWKAPRIIEHVVTVKSLPTKLSFTIVETKSLTKLADEKWGKIPESEYLKEEEKIHRKENTQGLGKTNLISMIPQFMGGTEAAYKKLVKRPDFKGDLDTYYAATVPHVMLWVPTGRLLVHKKYAI
jgi:hypothetical protein